jgi:hypothetical protein
MTKQLIADREQLLIAARKLRTFERAQMYAALLPMPQVRVDAAMQPLVKPSNNSYCLALVSERKVRGHVGDYVRVSTYQFFDRATEVSPETLDDRRKKKRAPVTEHAFTAEARKNNWPPGFWGGEARV